VWSSLDRFAEHAPTIGAACTLTAMAAVAIEIKRLRRSRMRRGCVDSAMACAASGLLAGVGAIVPAGLGVWMFPESPWPVLALSIPVGMTVDMAKEAGPLRLLVLSLDMVARVARAMSGAAGPDSRQPPDSDAP